MWHDNCVGVVLYYTSRKFLLVGILSGICFLKNKITESQQKGFKLSPCFCCSTHCIYFECDLKILTSLAYYGGGRYSEGRDVFPVTCAYMGAILQLNDSRLSTELYLDFKSK